MDVLNQIESDIEKYFNCRVIDKSYIGSGSSADAYKFELDVKPYKIVAKVCSLNELIKKEYETIGFINERVECKLPSVYYFKSLGECSYFVMSYIEGISGASKKIKYSLKRKKLANDIIDNLLKIQSVHNDKFGLVNNAVYSSWYEYYSDFAKSILNYTKALTDGKNLNAVVYKAVKSAYDNLDIILESTKDAVPTLIHGDYWMPNFIVNPKAMILEGVIDPFNIMWAEPEYELFCLTVGNGKNLRLYELYKSRVNVSAFCDLKVEMYALLNELFWMKNNSKVAESYLIMRSKRLIKQLRKNNIY